MTTGLLSTLKKVKQVELDELNYPEWVFVGPPITKLLYQATEEIFSELKLKINSGSIENIDLKNGPIIKAHIAKKADGASASNIRKDRQPKLYAHIDKRNRELLKLTKNKKVELSSGKRKTKSELEIENKELKVKIKKLEQEKYHVFFQQLIDSKLVNKQKVLALQNQKMAEELADNEETIRNLRKQVRQYLKQINGSSSD